METQEANDGAGENRIDAALIIAGIAALYGGFIVSAVFMIVSLFGDIFFKVLALIGFFVGFFSSMVAVILTLGIASLRNSRPNFVVGAVIATLICCLALYFFASFVLTFGLPVGIIAAWGIQRDIYSKTPRLPGMRYVRGLLRLWD